MNRRSFLYLFDRRRLYPMFRSNLKIRAILLTFLWMCAMLILYFDRDKIRHRIKINIVNWLSKEPITIDLIPVPSERMSYRSPPIILFWHSYFAKQYNHYVANSKSNIYCPYKCIYTTNRSFAHNASLRIFHERNLNGEDMPPNKEDAINVYYTWEPPYLSYSSYNDSKVPPNYFNAFASYRTSTEVYFPYDYFMEIDGSENEGDYWTDEQIEEKLDRKQKLALIAMSNCKAHSKRHKYVKELEKYMNITKLGRCAGNTKCGKDAGKKARRVDIKCMQNLIDEHYFHLAFENSVCPEYVTEKFWRVKELIVPVVLSRAIIPAHIPSDTYIAASDFESPKKLAEYLEYLVQNKDEYRKFFSWTKKYRKTRVKEEEIAVSCQLCKLAYQRNYEKIPDYKKHWSKDECVKDYALDLFQNYNVARKNEEKLMNIMDFTSRRRTIGTIL